MKCEFTIINSNFDRSNDPIAATLPSPLTFVRQVILTISCLTTSTMTCFSRARKNGTPLTSTRPYAFLTVKGQVRDGLLARLQVKCFASASMRLSCLLSRCHGCTMTLGLSNMPSKHEVHADLDPENILLADDKETSVHPIKFGQSFCLHDVSCMVDAHTCGLTHSLAF